MDTKKYVVEGLGTLDIYFSKNTPRYDPSLHQIEDMIINLNGTEHNLIDELPKGWEAAYSNRAKNNTCIPEYKSISLKKVWPKRYFSNEANTWIDTDIIIPARVGSICHEIGHAKDFDSKTSKQIKRYNRAIQYSMCPYKKTELEDILIFLKAEYVAWENAFEHLTKIGITSEQMHDLEKHAIDSLNGYVEYCCNSRSGREYAPLETIEENTGQSFSSMKELIQKQHEEWIRAHIRI